MIVKPICAAYDVNRKFGFNATEAITIEHEEDFKTRFIDLFLYENNIKNAVDVSGATVTARMVTTPEFDSLLLNDNVSCSIGEKQGHIVVPIDKAVLPSYPCEFLVEIHIENGEDVLVLPFPLWVKMNASILDDAGVTPESKGTVPELLEEATQALNEFKSDLYGKKLFVGGDSIMYGHGSEGYAIGEYLRDKYDMDLTKSARTGATLSTLLSDNNIYDQMIDLSENYDVFIFDGGVNDKARKFDLGSISNTFENFNPEKVIGSLESICRHLVLNYPNAIKLFVISNEMTTKSFTVNTEQIEYLEALIPVLNKWGIPYVNMLNTGIKAFNAEYNREFFYEEDRLHPKLSGYEAFYFKKIEKALLYGATDSGSTAKESSDKIDIADAVITLNQEDFTYDGSSHVPNVTAVTLNGQALTLGVDYAVVAVPATNAGDYVITISGMGDYSGTATANWTISKAQSTISGDDSISIRGIGESVSKTYTTNGDGAFSFSASGGVATVTNVGGTVTVTSTEIGSGTMIVTVAEGQNYLSAEKTVSITVEKVVTVFGVVWDYTLSSPEQTRLTPQSDPLNVVTAVPTQEPTACIGTEGGQSDFDNYMPWAGMQRFNYVNGQIVNFVDYTNGETYVYIPEFWSKIVDDSENQKMYIYISDSELNGFVKHPGSGKYMSRYECNSNFLSAPGTKPKDNVGLGGFRTGITAIDNKHYQYDIHTYAALELLYIVEFAHLNTQSKIGAGITSSDTSLTIGKTDILTYHTGRVNGTADNVSAVQYRWVENLWGNVWNWVDGILARNGLVYICNDRTKYDSSITNDYESTGLYTPTTIGWHKTDQAYNNCYLIPLSVGAEGSASTYTCDQYYYFAGVRGLLVGGNCSSNSIAGLFCWYSTNAPGDARSYIGGRTVLILNDGGNS